MAITIRSVFAYEILNSDGVPTVECSLTLSSGDVVVASVPSGTSRGSREALELRDGNENRYDGMGVLKAAAHINDILAPMVVGRAPDLISMDREFIVRDGTKDKSRLGANAILAMSMCVCKAQALAQDQRLYEFIATLAKSEPRIPVPMFNLVHGGGHALNGVAFQEFMLVPSADMSIGYGLERIVSIEHELKKLLLQKDIASSTGKEGGLVFEMAHCSRGCEVEICDLLHKAVGVKQDMMFAFDVAANNFYDPQRRLYRMGMSMFSARELIGIYEELAACYPICSIEDGLYEDDWAGWQEMTTRLSAQKIDVVGDDIFVTHSDCVVQGHKFGAGTAVLIKPNQVGTVSETLECVKVARSFGYKIIVSHRSGETLDSFIVDFAVGVAADRVKFGAPFRGERVAKYNRLLALEFML